MKVIPAPLLQHVQGTLTSLSLCWKITRKTDNVVLTFTDAAIDLFIGGYNYLSITGFVPTAVESSGNMSVDNMEVDGLLNSTAISADDIAAGMYDAAEVEVFYVNRTSMGDGAIPLKKGYIGQITLEQGLFKAEILGLLQPFQQNVVEIFSMTCRATLGDYRCKVDVTSKTVSGSITSLLDTHGFIDTARTEAAGYFNYGAVRFLTGACAGFTMEVKDFTGQSISLVLPMERALAVGDTYTLTPGCNLLISTCRDKFANVLNFRGEPDIPDPAAAMYPI